MKRLHVHVSVKDLDAAIAYYSAMFGTDPVKVKDDYAKWAPADLGVNFAVSTGCGAGGVGHLGIEVDEDDELARISMRLAAVSAPMRDEGEVKCCYAQSNKAWSDDPAGVAWELFHTVGESDALAPSEFKPSVAKVETATCC